MIKTDVFAVNTYNREVVASLPWSRLRRTFLVQLLQRHDRVNQLDSAKGKSIFLDTVPVKSQCF